MAFDQHTNFAFSLVQAGSGVIGSATGTTIVIVNALDLPDPAVGAYNVTVWPAGVSPTRVNAEIMRVTAKTATTLTVTRAQEGTTALSAIAAGFQVALTMTSKLLRDIEAVAGTGGGGGTGASPYAHLQQVLPSGTNGGSSAAATWTTCPLNTITADASSLIGSLTANQFTLAAGTYTVRAAQALANSTQNKLRIRNITDGVTLTLGMTLYSAAAGAIPPIILEGEFTIGATKTVALQYYVTAGVATFGLGLSVSSGENEVYADVVITKIA